MSLENQDNSTEFGVESQEYLADIERQLLAIETGGADLDVDLVNTVFRAAHSIRGAAGFMGLTTIGELAHALEDALNLMRNRDLAPTREVIDTLLRAADALRGLIADVARSNGADIAAHVAALQGMIEGNTAPAVQASLQQTVTVPTAAGVSKTVARAEHPAPPATRPTAAPKALATRTVTTPAASETREPQMMRESMSRPSRSVPSGYVQLPPSCQTGGLKRFRSD
jgi:two-component system chemotaxis sensor kinase CheA